jgi:photosystem II stability/assembly factor-like uncharacterized protein
MSARLWFRRSRRFVSVAAPIACVLAGVSTLAQSGSAWVMAQDAPENAALKGLRWRSIGPANPGGRISVVEGIPGKPDTFYVAGAAGGIAKTVNGGTTFTQIFDNEDVASIGAIEVANSDENIVWVGTGEGDPRNSTSFGNGVYRSTNGGQSWTHLGLTDTERIKRIAVDPQNADIAFVCAVGHTWGPNEERGVFKTTDGGKNWKKVLYKNPSTGCSDIAMDPADAKTLYAGMYTFLRKPYRFDSGGGETALYKSTDAGETWTKLTNGLPKGEMDRPGVAVSMSSPNIVYLISETKSEGTLFRSEDRGASWTKVSDNTAITFRPFYYDDIRVDPSNPNHLWALASTIQVSHDGGRSWAGTSAGMHGDQQAMWIDPKNPKRILSGCDGGFQISYDGGVNWEVINNVAFTQFYHVSFDNQQPYHLCGGLQDNGTWCGPSMVTSREGIRKRDWVTVSGGDGFSGVISNADPNLIFSDSQGGEIYVTNLKTNTSRQIAPYPKDLGSTGSAIAPYKYRFNWNTPIARSPQDPRAIYLGGNVLFRTINNGQSWDVLSPDLTTNDKAKQQSSGGDIVVDNTAAEFYCTIIAISESPKQKGVIWVGTDDGNIQVTKDDGKTWTNVVKNIQGLPPNTWIPNIDASPFDAGTAYVAVDRHRDNDFSPYAYKTTDFGQTWTPIRGNLPAKGYVHVVREDPRKKGFLTLGTELGVYASWNDGQSWVSLRNGLPAMPVLETVVQPRDGDLIIATHGRGIFIMDNIRPLEQLADAMKGESYLFDPPTAIRWQKWGRDNPIGAKEYIAQNPPTGAMIDFYAKNGGTPATMKITNATGQTVRTMTVPVATGVNRAMWDLRYDATADASGAAAPAGRAGGGGRGGGRGAGAPPAADQAPAGGRGAGGGGGGGGRGGGGAPYVLPGAYTIALTIGGTTYTKPLTVQMDPRITVSALELKAQLDAGMTLRNLTTHINALVAEADAAVGKLTAAAASTPAAGKVLDQAKDFRFRMGRVGQEQGYRIQGRLREEIQSLAGSVSANPGAPTAGELVRIKEVTADLDKMTAEWKAFVAGPAAQYLK